MVRGDIVELKDRYLDYLVLEQASEGVRHDLVVGPLDDERRYVELHQVLVLIRFGERLDAEEGAGGARHMSLEPEFPDDALRDPRARAVFSVVRHAGIPSVLRVGGLIAGLVPV